MSACPSCWHENPDGARFCNACGAPLAIAARETREERKRVTVVFCDLVGFTARAEQMDPEDVRALLAPYHARLRAELEHHGGTVEKFIGDAVMAVFGAPAAHEDDPERAVRAALAIRDWAADQPDLQVRIAVNTGDALVNLGARPSEGEAMVAGDVVNTAARMQVAAPVGGVLVGEATCRATDDAIIYRAAPPLAAKGKAEPVDVWEALHPLTRVGVDAAEHGRTPLTGRSRELELLHSHLRRVCDERAPQLLTLVGVPGIGKSRLVHELAKAGDREPALVTWRHGRCLPYGDGVAFWALGEMVKAEAGILETDGVTEAETKLERAIAGLVSDPGEERWLRRELRPLAGLPVEDGMGGGPDESAAAWRRFLEALADRGPTVLVFDDLHWAGDRLLDFVGGLVDWIRAVPLLVIGTARPELLQRRPAWGGGMANATTISLQPLSDDDISGLVEALMAEGGGPADDLRALLERSGGNPLFAEQYARMLTERGAAGGLPESVQAVIAARLDALPRAEKELLQDAAVHGKVFWLGAVASDRALDPVDAAGLLHTLERKDFVRRERRSVVAEDTQYAFEHVLVRDVAYAQLPRRARGEKHRRAAEWIERLGGSEDHSEMLAHHYQQALALSRAAGVEDDPSLVERTRRALGGAAERELSLSSHTAAARSFAAALELSPPDDPDRPRLLLGQGRALFAGSGDGLRPVLAALDGFRQAADSEGTAEAATVAGRFAWVGGDAVESDRLLRVALDAVADRPASPARGEALAHRCTLQMLTGELEAAIRTGAEAVPVIEALGREDLRARVDSGVGCARCRLGDPDGLEQVQSATSIAWKARALETLVVCNGNLAVQLFVLGRLTESADAWERGLHLIERYGLERWHRSYQAETAGWTFMYGRWGDALHLCDALIAQSDEGHREVVDPLVLSLRAAIRLACGDATGAQSDSERAMDLALRAGMEGRAAALCVRAAVHVDAGRRGEAERCASDLAAFGRALLPSLGSPHPNFADAAWVFRDLGLRADFVAVLEATPLESPWVDAARAIIEGRSVQAAEIIEGMGDPASAAYARLRAAEELAAEGRPEAQEQGHRAAAFYRTAGASALLRRTEEVAVRVAAAPLDG
jgi:class 3 adenylate cyclase